MIKNLANLLLRRHRHVCPWWSCFTFDNFMRKWFQDPVRILAPYVRPGDTALDIGPGMGYFSIPLAEMVGDRGRVIAADLQARMLARLKKRAAQKNIAHRIETHLTTRDALGITASVDFALAFWMVHEVPDQMRFFQEVRRLLKPDGTLLVAEPVMHVRGRDFDRTVRIAGSTGFRFKDRPVIKFSRTALFSGEN